MRQLLKQICSISLNNRDAKQNIEKQYRTWSLSTESVVYPRRLD